MATIEDTLTNCIENCDDVSPFILDNAIKVLPDIGGIGRVYKQDRAIGFIRGHYERAHSYYLEYDNNV